MKIRIMGSIVHPVEKPKQYFGMLDIYANEPPLLVSFNFTVLDNKELHPHILFFNESLRLFLDADCRAVPENTQLNTEQLGMYQILVSSVGFGIFNMLGRKLCGFNCAKLVHEKSERRQRKKMALVVDNVVPFMVEVVNLDEKQTKAILRLGTKIYNTGD